MSRPPLLRTVRVRLTLWYVALLGLILLAFGGALYAALSQSLRQQLDGQLVLYAHDLLENVDLSGGQPRFATDDSAAEAVEEVRSSGFLVRLLDAGGKVIGPTSGFDELPASPVNELAARPGQAELTTITDGDDAFRSYAVALIHAGQPAGALQVARDLEEVEETLSQLALALAVILPLTLAVAAVGGIFLAGRALAPVDQMTRAVQEISAHDLSQRLQTGAQLPDDELGRLARTFDAMLARLEEAFRRERDFTSNASHELRTPLTAMRGEIDVTLQRPRSPEEYQRALSELGEGVERLTRLSEDLLMLARADARQLPVSREALSAAQILEATAAEFEALAAARQIRLETASGPPMEFWGDESKMLRVLANLVDNALKFSPAGSRVRLAAASEAGLAVLTVSDEGPGIPAADQPHIFERFYRGHQPGGAEGSGLGLAIARALVLAQDGTLAVTSDAGHETRATIKMPLKSA
jgi:heavy metal sensor kinase